MIYCTDIQTASRCHWDCKAWVLRLEFIGRNEANKSGESAKFWQGTAKYSSGIGQTQVVVSWGKIGSTGDSSMTVPFRKFEEKYHEKIAKGYKVAASTTTVLPAPTITRSASRPIQQAAATKPASLRSAIRTVRSRSTSNEPDRPTKRLLGSIDGVEYFAVQITSTRWEWYPDPKNPVRHPSFDECLDDFDTEKQARELLAQLSQPFGAK